MNEQALFEVNLERTISQQFGLDVNIENIIGSRLSVSRSGEATLFLTDKKQLYLFIDSQSTLNLGDVRKIVAHMGLKADAYLPPKGRPTYFDDIGATHFQKIFPGRKVASPQDTAYYRTLAPYRPALVLIGEVIDGTVYQYDADARTNWRPSTKFTYRRIRTS